MTILIDTNIIARLANPADAQHARALDALAFVRSLGYTPSIVPQVLYESWVIATRPADQNGLGMTIAEAEADVASIVDKFHLFRDERAIFDYWYQLVTQHQVIGKTAHDARLVAAMKRHGISHLLTFNDGDFARFADITVVNPEAATRLPAAK